MGHYKYYTPIELANELLKILPSQKYDRIIDICCGSWNLLTAAYNLWPSAKFTGVDIDDESKEYKLDEASYYNEDGRVYALRTMNQQYDLVLSNPPFGYLDSKDRYLHNNFNDSHFTGLLNKRYENEMTLANILLTKHEGILLAILPSTFIEGASNAKARMQITEKFSVQSIIKLPLNTFKSGEINSYGIVLKKERLSNYNTKYYVAEFIEKWTINYQEDILKDKIDKGIWSPSECVSALDKGELTIFRGNISSSYFNKRGRRILHCSSDITEDGIWLPSVRHCNVSKKILDNAKYAFKNDIIINRIGKSAGFWCVNPHEKILVSDCLLVLKNESEALSNPLIQKGAHKLKIPIRGLTTSYITASDVRQHVNNHIL